MESFHHKVKRKKKSFMTISISFCAIIGILGMSSFGIACLSSIPKCPQLAGIWMIILSILGSIFVVSTLTFGCIIWVREIPIRTSKYTEILFHKSCMDPRDYDGC